MYNLIIIGSGAAGIACAHQAKKLGLSAVLIDEDKDSFGGTCLNRGCIPTKLFLNSAKLNKSWKDTYLLKKAVVNKIKTQSLQFLQKQGLEVLWGKVSFLDKNSLKVGSETIVGKYIVVASGSLPKLIIDDPKVISADALFKQREIPEKVLIVGGGYIGIEIASLLNSFGSNVSLVERENSILPFFNPYLANRLRIILQRKGIKIETDKSYQDCKLDEYDLIISAVGRKPNTESLELANAGIDYDSKGWIKTNEHLATNIDNIYACGDVTGKKLLAYVGEYQAKICIPNIKEGNHLKENYSNIPECVFSQPSLARIGILEDQAKAQGLKYRVIQSNFLKFSSSYVYGDTDGFIQIVVSEDDTIIGAGVISTLAAELISTLTLCVRKHLKLSDLKEMLLIHPSLSEILSLIASQA